MLTHPRFQASERASDFLVYVVEETLAGRGSDLSERRVGRYALGLPTDADGGESALVRVHATRLRKLLASYYEGPGSGDDVRIVIPVGRYAPRFLRRHDLSHDPVGPRVLVTCTPAGALGGQDPQPRACHLVGSELRRFPGMQVVVPTDDDRGPRVFGNTDYVLGSLVGSDGRHGRATLVHRETGELLWSSTDDADLSEPGRLPTDEEWAARVAARVGDYSGTLLRHYVHHPPSEPTAIQVASWRSVPISNRDRPSRPQPPWTRSTQRRRRGPGHRCCSRCVRRCWRSRHPRPTRGERTSSRSRSGWPGRRSCSTRRWATHMALATTSMLRKEWDLAVRQADEAVRLSPHHPILLATSATVLARRRSLDLRRTGRGSGVRPEPGAASLRPHCPRDRAAPRR